MNQKRDTFLQLLHQYNIIFKENDELYRRLADQFGLSDSAFWILYTLQEQTIPITQKQLCESTYSSKQTINSALKSLERNGYISLTTGKDRRRKFLILTDAGKELASRTVDLVLQQEQKAIASIGTESMEQMLSFFQIYTDALKQQFQAIFLTDDCSKKENSYENPVI